MQVIGVNFRPSKALKSAKPNATPLRSLELHASIRPMQHVFILVMAALLVGCGAMAKDNDWSAELKATAEKCGIPSEHLQFVDGSVRWIAPETITYDQVKCGFDELKARGVPTKQGYYVAGGR